MVYGFARQSHGHVRIYSEDGQGTMVCIYLPRDRGGVAEEAAPVAEAGPEAEAGQTVLIIDDEPTVRMLMVDALSDLGYTCLEAGGRIDPLITDVSLPGSLNGRQVADAARVLRQDLHILFVTGYADNAVLNHGHIAPGMEVLTKPFAVDELRRRVATLIKLAE